MPHTILTLAGCGKNHPASIDILAPPSHQPLLFLLVFITLALSLSFSRRLNLARRSLNLFESLPRVLSSSPIAGAIPVEFRFLSFPQPKRILRRAAPALDGFDCEILAATIGDICSHTRALLAIATAISSTLQCQFTRYYPPTYFTSHPRRRLQLSCQHNTLSIQIHNHRRSHPAWFVTPLEYH